MFAGRGRHHLKKRRAAIVDYDSPVASLAGIKTTNERQSKKMDFVADISMICGDVRIGGYLGEWAQVAGPTK